MKQERQYDAAAVLPKGVSSELQSTTCRFREALPAKACTFSGAQHNWRGSPHCTWAPQLSLSLPGPHSSSTGSIRRGTPSSRAQCAAGSVMSGAGSAIAAALAEAGLPHLAPSFEHLSLPRFKGLLIQVGRRGGQRSQ